MFLLCPCCTSCSLLAYGQRWPGTARTCSPERQEQAHGARMARGGPVWAIRLGFGRPRNYKSLTKNIVKERASGRLLREFGAPAACATFPDLICRVGTLDSRGGSLRGPRAPRGGGGACADLPGGDPRKPGVAPSGAHTARGGPMWAILVGLGGQESTRFCEARAVKRRASRRLAREFCKHVRCMLWNAPLP